MFEWATRATVLDVSINAVPAAILAYFVGLTALRDPWPFDTLTVVLTHVLTVFPILVLAFATYHVARAVELDAGRS